MPSASTIRLQVEAALSHMIPSALTPATKTIRPAAATGIDVLDALLAGGLPVGAVTELPCLFQRSRHRHAPGSSCALRWYENERSHRRRYDPPGPWRAFPVPRAYLAETPLRE